MDISQSLFPLKAASGFTEVDGTIQFYNSVNSLLVPGARVLDFGGGRGAGAEDDVVWRRALVGTQLIPVHRIAVDIDPIVMENPFAQERFLLKDDFAIPLDAENVDLVILDWVVEHLPDPVATFRECHRVLKYGGHLCIRTSNLYYYAYLAASLLKENRLADSLLSRVQPEREEKDVFPKVYGCNTQRTLKRACGEAGFRKITVFTWDSEPAYVGHGRWLNYLGFIYHRLALAGVLPRTSLLGFIQK